MTKIKYVVRVDENLVDELETYEEALKLVKELEETEGIQPECIDIIKIELLKESKYGFNMLLSL